MLIPFLFKVLPGPAWLRVLVLLAVAAAIGVFLWDDGFSWLMQHSGSLLGGSPVVR